MVAIIKERGGTIVCLINFQLGAHPNYKLIVAANRDEFYERPTAQAHFWEDEPDILAGRDLRGKGTWLGITKQGRFAALTNIRKPKEDLAGKKSRGVIIKNYLAGRMGPESFLKDLTLEKDLYAGFNLLVGTPDYLYYFNNAEGKIEKVNEGTHGLSNHFLNTPWPKVVQGKQMLKNYVNGHEAIESDVLFEILTHSDETEEGALPHTGVSIELEKKLSPLFIQTPNYGTRSSTVLLVNQKNNVIFEERTYKYGKFNGEEKFSFQIEG